MKKGRYAKDAVFLNKKLQFSAKYDQLLKELVERLIHYKKAMLTIMDNREKERPGQIAKVFYEKHHIEQLAAHALLHDLKNYTVELEAGQSALKEANDLLDFLAGN